VRISSSSRPIRGWFRRSPFQAPARCTFEAATRPSSPAPNKDLDQFWDDTVAAFGQELSALAAAGAASQVSTRPIRSSAGIPRSKQVAGVARRRLERADRQVYAGQPHSRKNAPAECGSACILAAATAAASGTPRAATTRVADRLFNAPQNPVYVNRIRFARARQLHAVESRAAATRQS